MLRGSALLVLFEATVCQRFISQEKSVEALMNVSWRAGFAVSKLLSCMLHLID